MLAVSPEYMLAIGARERSEGDALGAVVNRVNGQVQDIDRVHTLCRIVIDIDGVVVGTGIEVVVSTPIVVVTLTNSHLVGVGVRHRCSCFVTYAQAVNTVATEAVGMTLIVPSVVVNRLTAPGCRLTRNKRQGVVQMERATLYQNGGYDRVTVVLNRSERINQNL